MTAWLKDVIGYGLLAARPAAGSEGVLYYATDTQLIYRDDGSTWDTLTVASPTAFKGARLFHSTSQNVNSATVTALTFDTEAFDTDAFHSSGAPTRLTVPTGLDGYYHIGGNIRFPTATAIPETFIRLNGSTNIVDGILQATSAGVAGVASTLYALSAGDYLELCAYQASGGTLSIASTSAYSPSFWLYKVG